MNDVTKFAYYKPAFLKIFFTLLLTSILIMALILSINHNASNFLSTIFIACVWVSFFSGSLILMLLIRSHVAKFLISFFVLFVYYMISVDTPTNIYYNVRIVLDKQDNSLVFIPGEKSNIVQNEYIMDTNGNTFDLWLDESIGSIKIETGISGEDLSDSYRVDPEDVKVVVNGEEFNPRTIDVVSSADDGEYQVFTLDLGWHGGAFWITDAFHQQYVLNVHWVDIEEFQQAKEKANYLNQQIQNEESK